MQYILSQQELDALKDVQAAKISTSKSTLQEFCTLAALHIPVYRKWDKSLTPWGCILVSKGESNPRYCDECPAKQFCPSTIKEFSQ